MSQHTDVSAAAPDRVAARGARSLGGRLPGMAVAYLQALPLMLVLAVFLVVPILTIVVVSFWDFDEFQLLPDFVLNNYADVLGSAVTWKTYLETLKLAVLTWALTAAIGFWVAYFLAFHVRGLIWQTGLFLLCTIPFWTSNIIRMISWVPFLGRNGLLNALMLRLHLIDQPLEFLLFSDFAVVLAFVHLYTLFMVVPIFNSMMRIDRSVIEAAIDAGAGPAAVVWNIVLPLAKPGLAIGSIFVLTLVMGDFVTVRLMSGGQSASLGLLMANEMSLLQYPTAAATAIILLITVLLMIAALMRAVDIRKEL
ncbi:MAG TPA: ABC transporter permease [Stellaceae bacterium]|nr:ABC transporter permease [Stellaceae bacterium]